MTGPLPEWLVDQITVKTGAAPGAGKLARRRCTRCRAMVFVGLDGPVAALNVVVDPEPIATADAEAAAIADHRRTYALRRHGRTIRLQRRDQWMRARTPAGTQPEGILGYTIVAEHACREGVR